MLKQACVGVVAALVLAAPAAAGSGHGNGHRGQKFRGHGHSGYASYGHGYRGHRNYGHYGHHSYSDDAFLWLGLTAIGVKALDVFNDAQQRRFEAAQRQAATAPIGQSIVWTSGSAAGAVTPVRQGYDSSGHLCREFQQEIQVGGRTEQGWGIACLQQDGSWRMAY
jgi:hypothetical protein